MRGTTKLLADAFNNGILDDKDDGPEDPPKEKPAERKTVPILPSASKKKHKHNKKKKWFPAPTPPPPRTAAKLSLIFFTGAKGTALD